MAEEKRETVFEPSEYLSNLVPRSARLLDYFGVWAMEESAFRAAVECLNDGRLYDHIVGHGQLPDFVDAEILEAEPTRGFEVLDGGVALIRVEGKMMKHESSLGGTSTVGVRKALRAAVKAEDVTSIALLIDSAGGMVDGAFDLADEVRNTAAKKPVESFIEDSGLSAAYLIASQGDRIFANTSALVGSVGVFTVIEDTSEAAARLGVKVHVIRSSASKAVGQPGEPITEAHVAEMQRLVDGLNGLFIDAISRGRSITCAKAEALADGRVHLAGDAVKLGLIDGVKSLDEVLSSLASRNGSRSGARADAGPVLGSGGALENEGGHDMSDEGKKVEGGAAVLAGPATYEEIKGACEGADSDFIVSQLEAKATAEQARGAYMAALNARVAEAEAATKAAEAKATSAEEAASAAKALQTSGVEAIGDGGGGAEKVEVDGDPIAAFDAAVAARMEAKKCPQHVAHRWVCKTHGELREAMVASFNNGYADRKAKIAAQALAAQAGAA